MVLALVRANKTKKCCFRYLSNTHSKCLRSYSVLAIYPLPSWLVCLSTQINGLCMWYQFFSNDPKYWKHSKLILHLSYQIIKEAIGGKFVYCLLRQFLRVEHWCDRHLCRFANISTRVKIRSTLNSEDGLDLGSFRSNTLLALAFGSPATHMPTRPTRPWHGKTCCHVLQPSHGF